MKTFLATLLTSTLLLAAACGGGGGGGGEGDPIDEAPPADVIGPYLYVELVGRPQSFRFTEAGATEVDGTGLLTGDTQRYFDFLTSPEGVSPQRILVASGDGTLRNVDTEGEPLRGGGVGEGNHLALLAANDNSPNLVALTRPTASSQGVIRPGRHHFVLFAPREGASDWGRVDLAGDGTGVLTVVATRNVNGAIGASSIETVNVSLAPNGGMTVEAFGEGGPPLEFEGVASDGGRLLFGSRTDENNAPQPMIVAAVRAPTNADELLFAGRYWIAAYFARYDEDRDERDLGTLIGTVEADGLGGCRLDGVLNLDGSFQDITDENGTYEVESDGTLRLFFDEFFSEGGIDARGRHAVLGGGTIEGFSPQLVLLARQPVAAAPTSTN